MIKMQKIIILSILFFPLATSSAGEAQSIRGLSNEIYRLSEEMVHHGGEGHTDEIIQYGEKMVERIERLINRIQLIDRLKRQKKEIVASLILTRNTTHEAIRLGRNGDAKAAYQAARLASSQARKSRQKIDSLS